MPVINRHSSLSLDRISRLYKVLLISGPRQVGKTFLAKSHFPNHKWVLLDSLSLIDQARNDPALFLKNNPPPVIFDEIQRVPELILEIKALIDSENIGLAEVVLTGSQPLSLMDHISESLAGRVGILELTPCTPSELAAGSEGSINLSTLIEEPPIGREFPLSGTPNSLLFRGGLPAMALAEHSPETSDVFQRFSDYVATYLTRDLRDIAEVKDLGRFERWLRLLSTISGKIPNILELSQQIGLPQSTAHEWTEILKSSLLIHEIPAYHRNLTKRESKKSKLALFDSGLTCHLLGYNSDTQLEKTPFLGSIFETAVISALRSQCVRQLGRSSLYHWRSKEKVECDLILEINAEDIIPIEIKYSSRISKDELSGIKQFMKISDHARMGLVFSPDSKCFWLDEKILHLPWGAL
jgi:predicted AAA+ superfamily ATPase